MRKVALITGATAGIGKAVALRLAEEKFDLIITGRRKERLEELRKEIEINYKVRVIDLCFDVTKLDEVEKALGNLPQSWGKVDVLINNAGLAVGLSPIHEGLIDDWERMIDTNIKGLLYVTRTIAPGMVERKSGHIVNLSSIAGKEVYPSGNVYCATKHAVTALSKAMRMDMLQHGIRVTLVCPGAVNTEFSFVRFKGDQARADQVYDGFTPLMANDIAEAVAYAVLQPKHVDVQELLVMPTAQAGGAMFHKEK